METPATFVGERCVWKVDGRLGVGSTALVYRVVGPDGEVRALKQVLDAAVAAGVDLMAEADRLDAFAEAEHAQFGEAERRFPRVHDRDPAGRWFVMDRAQGTLLEAVLSAGQALKPSQCVRIALRVAEALTIVEQRGERARDLKPDAIFWGPSDGVMIVDWTVSTDTGEHGGAGEGDDEGRGAADARLVGGLLDALMTRRRVLGWRGGFDEPPARWGEHPRGVATVLWLCASTPPPPMDDVRAALAAVDVLMAEPPDALVERARAALVEAVERVGRDAQNDVGAQVEAAVEAAELARLEADPSLRFVIDELLDRARGYQGDDAGKLAALWRLIGSPGALDAPGPGEALELIRLRALAGVSRRAPGYAGSVETIARAFAAQAWAEVRRRAEQLSADIGDGDASGLLADIGLEAQLFEDMSRALRYEARRDAQRSRRMLDRVRAALGRLGHGDRLLMAFPAFEDAFEVDTGAFDSAVSTPDAPMSGAIEAARRRFALHGETRLDDLGAARATPAGEALGELVGAWQALYDTASQDHGVFVDRMLGALRASASLRGCLPLPDLASHGRTVCRRLEATLREQPGTRQGLGAIEAIEPRVQALVETLDVLRRSLGESELPATWRGAVRDALGELEGKLTAFATRVRQLVADCEDWFERARGWTLPQRLEQVEVLVARHADVRLVRDVRATLVDDVNRLSIDRPDTVDLDELNEARGLLGFPPLAARSSGRAGVVIAVLMGLVGAVAVAYGLSVGDEHGLSVGPDRGIDTADLVEVEADASSAGRERGAVGAADGSLTSRGDAGVVVDAEVDGAAVVDAAVAVDTAHVVDTAAPQRSAGRRRRIDHGRRQPVSTRPPRPADAGRLRPGVRIRIYEAGSPDSDRHPIPSGYDAGF